jgi:hypothetical protein
MQAMQENDSTFNPENPAVIEVYDDYFGWGDAKEFTFPDGKQKIFFKVMNEGERKKFQQKTNRDIRFNQSTRDAHLKTDAAEERWQLITNSVTGWSLKRRNANGGWSDVPFSVGSPGAELEKWLERANPKIVDDLEFAIRMANPWMQADMTVAEIDIEMNRLVELRKAQVEKERGEDASSNK